MTKRTKNYNEHLAQKMENIEFAQNYLMSLIKDHGEKPENALKETISKMGITEFCDRANMLKQHVSAFINGKRTFSVDKIDECLRAFDLKIILQVEKAASPRSRVASKRRTRKKKVAKKSA